MLFLYFEHHEFYVFRQLHIMIIKVLIINQIKNILNFIKDAHLKKFFNQQKIKQ